MSGPAPTYERIIVRRLFEATGYVDLFEFHERYRISAAQILDCCDRYGREGLIQRSGMKAQLTAAGRLQVWQNRRAMFSVGRAANWRYFKQPKDWREEIDAVHRPHFSWLGDEFDSSSREEFLKAISKR